MANTLTGPAQRPDLVRGLGLWAATAVVIGDTIGSGVFLVTSDMARAVGTAALVFVAWIVGGVIVLFGAFCYAELGATFPKAGGPYVYLSQGLGPLWGFLFGWMSSFLERPVAMAALAAGFLRFLGFLFPVVTTPLYSGHIMKFDFTVTLAQPLAALVVLLVTAMNYLSVKFSGGIQVLLTSLKVGTIVLIVVGGVVFGAKHAGGSAPFVNSLTTGSSVFATIGAVLSALVPAMWAYNGFNDLGDLGEEILQPQKNIPRAIIIGLFVVAGLYLLANVVYFRALPFASIAASQHVASDVVQSFGGSRGASWLTVGMAISALGALHVVVLTGARIPYAMARDGVFFKFAGRIHPRLRTPSGALIFLGCPASLLALSGTYEQLYSLFVFSVWIFFALTAIALLRLRKKQPNLTRAYRAWGYPATPLIFLIAAVALTVNLWMLRPVRSSLGLLVILAGVPFFYLWRKNLAPPA
ncbi:MAG TPA: amino acid permease [Candidatus Dormibacteraeota bacterium]|jgi:APA family basic amino acid/polyamine antiporter|nr:amino acid permease [Candidatus Dormibacteraeota bacterium]